jgi:hypothetical protein
MSLFELLFETGAEYGDSIAADRGDVRKVESRLAKLRVDAATAIRLLAQENDRLKLYCAALGRLLLKKGIVTLEELGAMLDSVDLEDGVADGKLRGRPLPGERVRVPSKPRPSAKDPVVPKQVGKRPVPPKQPLAKPPKGWKPKGAPIK